MFKFNSRFLFALILPLLIINDSAFAQANISPAPAAIEDCLCALRWVIQKADRYGFDANKLVVSGHSAGGHLALITIKKIKDKVPTDPEVIAALIMAIGSILAATITGFSGYLFGIYNQRKISKYRELAIGLESEDFERRDILRGDWKGTLSMKEMSEEDKNKVIDFDVNVNFNVPKNKPKEAINSTIIQKEALINGNRVAQRTIEAKGDLIYSNIFLFNYSLILEEIEIGTLIFELGDRNKNLSGKIVVRSSYISKIVTGDFKLEKIDQK